MPLKDTESVTARVEHGNRTEDQDKSAEEEFAIAAIREKQDSLEWAVAKYAAERYKQFPQRVMMKTKYLLSQDENPWVWDFTPVIEATPWELPITGDNHPILPDTRIA